MQLVFIAKKVADTSDRQQPQSFFRKKHGRFRAVAIGAHQWDELFTADLLSNWELSGSAFDAQEWQSFRNRKDLQEAQV